MKKIAVIGSGIAGLATAIRLSTQGHQVSVFEANSFPGGKIAELRQDGFRFDMGPSVLTMPEYIDELFQLAGENPRVYFNYHKLDPVFHYFFEDGSVIRTFSDPEKLAAEFAQKTSVCKAAIHTFLKKSRAKYDITNPVFLQRSLHQIQNYFNFPTLYGLLNFGKIEAFTTMAKSNRKLFQDDKVEAILNRYAAYNGSDPYLAPATLNVIAHIELGIGAYYPEGGMSAVPDVLHGLAKKCGVRFFFNARVKEIVLRNGKATGIRSNHGEDVFDRVISNADVFSTYRDLLPGEPAPDRTLAQPKSSSVIVFYWGMDREFPEVGLHNMFMSGDQHKEFHELRVGQIPVEPTIYVYVSSKMNCEDAPAGCENWFVMVTVPNNQGQDWQNLVAETRKTVLQKLSSRLNENLELQIRCERVLNPGLIEKRTSSAFGSVFGNSSNSKFAAFLRHPNFSKKIKHLYFCGGSVHPGAGIPLCLLSGKIVAEMITD